METAIAGPRRWLTPMVALLALGVLVAMVVSGQVRENKQFVKFVPAGVMSEAPADIDRIELRTISGRWVFVRGPDGWRGEPEGRVLSASMRTHLEDSIKFMHVSAPIRVMGRAEWATVGLREFGLDPPGYTATLYHRNAPVLDAEFGSPNPQKVLQYMKLRGRDDVYLMARFVGEEWEKALSEAAAR